MENDNWKHISEVLKKIQSADETYLTEDYYDVLNKWIEEEGENDCIANALISTALAEVNRLEFKRSMAT